MQFRSRSIALDSAKHQIIKSVQISSKQFSTQPAFWIWFFSQDSPLMGLHSDSLRFPKVVALQCGSRCAPGAIPTSGEEHGKTLEACCEGLKNSPRPKKNWKTWHVSRLFDDFRYISRVFYAMNDARQVQNKRTLMAGFLEFGLCIELSYKHFVKAVDQGIIKGTIMNNELTIMIVWLILASLELVCYVVAWLVSAPQSRVWGRANGGCSNLQK